MHKVQAPTVISAIRSLISDVPDTVDVNSYKTKRWDGLKHTETTVEIQVGLTKLTITLEQHDEVASAV